MRRTRLVIADQHPVVLHGLMSVFAPQRDFEIVASCNSGTSCIAAIRNLAPDVALLEDLLPDVTASEILAIANAENLPTRLVFFTSSVEQSGLAAAIADGACSEISKEASPETLLQSLRLVTESISLLPEPSPELAPAEKEANGANIENALLTMLTDREREIMRLVAEGLSNKEIARQLNLSDGTIKVHLHHIYQKLDINNRTVLAALALSQRHGGFGMLALAALTFATMGDARAEDPNETILDDDNIAYKDLEHGVFELWTKEAVPRHIVVEDPGKTVVMTRTGSSFSVSQTTNSAARMEELQAAQQAVLSNFAKGYGPSGSSTPYNYNAPTPQPINYVLPGGPTPQGSLPPLELAPNPVFEPTLPPPLPPPPPVPPSLNPATGPTLIDTAAFDTFAAASGTFVANSPRQGATLTYNISGGSAGNVVVDGNTYDVSKAGHYGTLYLNSATGAYTYVPDDDAINALSAPTTENFTITVGDGTLSTSQTYAVAINGANDTAIITGSTSASLIEAGGSASAAAGTLSATGTLTDTDVDNPVNTFTAVTSPTRSEKGYGSFTMTASGVWTYTLDNGNGTVQALNAGETVTDTFTVSTVDGTTQVVTITIAGTNDAAVISGETAGTVVEAGGNDPGTPVATGMLTDTDVDNADNAFVAVTTATASARGYGSFTMTAAGAWTYTLDNTDPTVQALNAGEALTDTFTVTTVDGTAQVVTITINGSNDEAVISGTTTGSVTEASGTAPGTPVAAGTLTAADPDNTANAFIAVVSPAPSTNGYGSFTMTAAGTWTYTVDNGNEAVQALNAGESLTDTFTVTSVDGTTQAVTITIHGSNDAAVISGTTTGSVVEAGVTTTGTQVATGTLTDTDVDNADDAFIAVTSQTASSKGYGTFTMTAAGAWTYTLNNNNATVQALNTGEALTDTFTLTTVDGTTQVVTVTIAGSNDAAVISGATNGSVVEAGATTSGTQVAIGTVTDTDVDNEDNAFIAVTSQTASSKGYGSFMVTSAGAWTYTLNNTNPTVQALNAGETLTDTFTVTTVDGTTQVVTITIAGSNDAAVISGTTTGSVIEAGGSDPGTPIATGTLTDIDVDNEDNTFIAVTTPTASTKGYGTFMMTVAGAWTYTLDNSDAAVQALDPGETLTDTFTVTTIDGTTQVVTVVIHGSSDADPNDFDNLAPGPSVVSDPPFVFGTPEGETLAGGGAVFQIVYGGKGDDTVNGTSLNDTLYGGSGNDTMKGNGGDDTAYGGSGSDDINGNNGNDTIIGGFGADKLTGSNGDDVFVYLSVADSNATAPDTITDFASGSDKINLAAFGALAFLHLEPNATSVPPHTVAWIYDSASNQTIVYVNATDGALDIGDAALLEIHLQGVTSVSESDFIFDNPAAAATVVAAAEGIDPALEAIAAGDTVVLAAISDEASTGTTDGASAHASADGWTLRAADETFKFHFDGGAGTIGSVRLARFDEASVYAAAVSEGDDDGDAVVALASGSPIELRHDDAKAEEHFAFHQGPAHASASAVATGEPAVVSPAGTVEATSFTVANAAAAAEPVEHGNGGPHPSHELHTASEENGPNNPHSESNPAPGGHGHSAAAHASAGPIETVETPEHGNSNETPASKHADTAESEEMGPAPASVAHGHADKHGGPAESPVIETAALSPAEEHAAAHAEAVEKPEHGNSSQHKNEVANHAETAELEDSASASHGHGAKHGEPAENPVMETAALSPAEKHAAQAQIAEEPGDGQSFHFKNDVAASNHESVALQETADPASIAHGQGGPGGPATIELAELTAPEDPASAHAHGAQSHSASHGMHDLIV